MACRRDAGTRGRVRRGDVRRLPSVRPRLQLPGAPRRPPARRRVRPRCRARVEGPLRPCVGALRRRFRAKYPALTGERGAPHWYADARRDAGRRAGGAAAARRARHVECRPCPLPRPMDFAFILDPLPDLKAYKDSSVAMMRALARARARDLRAPAARHLLGRGRHARARRAARRSRDDHDWYAAGEAEDARAQATSPR